MPIGCTGIVWRAIPGSAKGMGVGWLAVPDGKFGNVHVLWITMISLLGGEPSLLVAVHTTATLMMLFAAP